MKNPLGLTDVTEFTHSQKTPQPVKQLFNPFFLDKNCFKKKENKSVKLMILSY